MRAPCLEHLLGLLKGTCCGVISILELLKIMKDYANVRTERTEELDTIVEKLLQFFCCNKCWSEMTLRTIFSDYIQSYVILPDAFSSSCHRGALVGHWIECSWVLNAMPRVGIQPQPFAYMSSALSLPWLFCLSRLSLSKKIKLNAE